MKKISTLFLCAVAAMAAVSCSKEIQNEQPSPEVELFPMTITATSTDTKTQLVDRVSIKWLATDELSVFDGVDNQKFTSKGEGKTVEFEGEAAQAATYYALYPYDEAAELTGTTVTTSLLDEQPAVAGTFADGLNINASSAAATDDFHFTNVLAVAKINVSAANLDGHTIKTVELSSTYPLAGDMVVTYGETITAAAGVNSVKTVSLVSSEGFAEGDYYFCVVPNAGGEITLTFTDTEDKVATKTANLSNPFTAGTIKNLGSVKGLTWEEPVTDKYFVKISDTGDLEAGKYLIVYEDGSLAMDGSLETLDAIGNTFDVRIADGKILADETTLPNVFMFESVEGGWAIKSSKGKYIGQTKDENGMQTSSSAILNIISIEEGDAAIVSGGAHLRYNAASNQTRFRYFKSASYTNQKAIALYLYDAVIKEPVEMSFNPSEVTLIQGEEFTAPSLSMNPSGLAVTYSSSDEKVATVDVTTGEVTIVGVGSTKITATFAGDETYKKTSAYYTLTVNGASATSLAQVKSDLANGATSFTANLTNVIVTRKFSDYIAYIQDETAGFLITDAENLNEGDSYSGTITGSMQTYKNQPEITEIDLSNATKTEGVTIPDPIVVTTTQLRENMATYDGRLCIIKKAKAKYTLESGGSKSVDIVQGEDVVSFFTRVSFPANTVVAGSYYDVIGLPTKFNSLFEIVVLKTTDVTEVPITWNLNEISVKTKPKTDYQAGQKFDPAGLVILAAYEDSTDPTITKEEEIAYTTDNASLFSFNPSLETELATSNTFVSITYGGKSVDLTIAVSPAGQDAVVYTLEPATGSNNAYANNCDITIGGITWNVTGNAQTIPWRIGGKSLSGVDREIYSKTALEKSINKIEITHGAASSITVNSMTVIVASDASFANVVSTLTPTFVANGTVTVNRPDGADWSKCYYKIVYNVTVSGTSNKFLEFTEAKFWGK